MEKMLSCPIVYQDKRKIGYGGDQAWFLDKWAMKAGCASVSATNIRIYYTNPKKEYQKEEYLRYMEETYATMEPKKRGYPYAYLYARRVKELVAKDGVALKYQIVRRPTCTEALTLVTNSIDLKNPIGLLILTHRRRKVRDDLWHWVTIFGYKETPKGIDIIFSDCGEKKEIPARILFEKHWMNVVKLVVFDKQ